SLATLASRDQYRAPHSFPTRRSSDLSGSTSANFTFHGSDPTSGGVSSGVNHVECSLDAAAFATCISPKSYSGLTAGSHTFTVRGSDKEKSALQPPAHLVWRLQPTPPD